MTITRDRSRRILTLDQQSYLMKILKCFNMENANIAQTPLLAGYKPAVNDQPVDAGLKKQYQSIIGSLLYLTLGTIPDIAYTVIKLSQYSVNLSKWHMNAAKHVMKYLAGSTKYKLVFDGKSTVSELIAFTDSDWASDEDNRRLQTGYFIKIADAVVVWNSHKQTAIALSSTGAEYMALCNCCKQVIWVQNLFHELGVKFVGDNQDSLFIASNPVADKRTKHIDICFHFI